jgi:hypothetical protein
VYTIVSLVKKNAILSLYIFKRFYQFLFISTTLPSGFEKKFQKPEGSDPQNLYARIRQAGIRK